MNDDYDYGDNDTGTATTADIIRGYKEGVAEFLDSARRVLTPEQMRRVEHAAIYGTHRDVARELGYDPTAKSRRMWDVATRQHTDRDGVPYPVNVITYALVYRPGKITLCAAHDSSEAAGVALGPVQRGMHRGRCDVCMRAAKRA